MPAPGWWQPRVLRSSGSVVEAVYGLILATSVIAVSRDYDASNAGVIGVTVLVTGIVFWLAHVYARVLARWIDRRQMPDLSDVREAMRHDWPLVEVTLPVVFILLLGALDVLPDRAAIIAATIAALAELAWAGGYAAHASGARAPATITSA